MVPARMHAAALAAALALAACASHPVDAQWSSPQLAGQPLRAARVLVVCEAAEEVLVRLCQDRLGAELAARGLTALPVPEGTPLPAPGAVRDDTRYLAPARAVRASAVWVASVGADAYAAERSGSGMSIGIGGFSFGRSSSVGVGVSVPVAGGPPPTAYAADMRITEVAGGRLLWTARAGAGSGGDAREQIDGLMRRLFEAADQAPLY
ncbi:MAG TPA: hypothetical protein VJ743_13685 [Albitalea sp.]|nr:hypothetical protein [Albitalea sp.]